MFKFNTRGKRIGRIAFGVVLLAGVGILVQRIVTLEEAARSAQLIATTWVAAFAAYAIAGWLGSRRSLDHAEELAVPGLVLPSVGVALLMPLTLHLPVVALIADNMREFDSWAFVSAVITGPTHIVFAVLAGVRARQLATGRIAISPMVIYGICIAVSCVPFALLVLPPFIVMLTGIPLIALMVMTERLALRDRWGAAAEALPRAIAVRSPDAAESLPRSA